MTDVNVIFISCYEVHFTL